MTKNLLREVTPLTENDCFTIFSRVKKEFTFPLHNHDEYELNLIINAGGAKRIIGDHIEVIDDLELVLVGPSLQHGWFTHECKDKEIKEYTIQFHKELFDSRLLQRNQWGLIRDMFEKSKRGILFSKSTTEKLIPQLLSLSKKTGFDSMIAFLSILQDLSISRDMLLLSDATFDNADAPFNSRRIQKAFEYMNKRYEDQITLAEVAKYANMPESSFSRFIKKRTGYTFIDNLNEIRLGHVSRLLINTTHSVAEVAYKCGFNNISNFNRIFRKRKGCTPKEFRQTFYGERIFV